MMEVDAPVKIDVSNFPLTELQCILKYLSGSDLLEYSMVNHHWYAATCGHVLWRLQCERDYLLESDTTCLCAQQEGPAITACLLKQHYIKYIKAKRLFCEGPLETYHLPIELNRIRLFDCSDKRMVICYDNSDLDIWQVTHPLFLSFRSNQFPGTIDVKICKDILYVMYQGSEEGTSTGGVDCNLFMYRLVPAFAMELPQANYVLSTDTNPRAVGVKLLPINSLHLYIYKLQWYATTDYIVYFNTKTNGLCTIHHESGTVQHKTLPTNRFDINGWLFENNVFYFASVILPCDAEVFAYDCIQNKFVWNCNIHLLRDLSEIRVILSIWKTDFVVFNAKDKIILFKKDGTTVLTLTWFTSLQSHWHIPVFTRECSDFFHSIAIAKNLTGRASPNFSALDFVVSPYGAMILADHGSYFHFISRSSHEDAVKSIEWNPPGYVQIKAKRDIWHISRRSMIIKSAYRDALFVIVFLKEPPQRFY